MDQKQQQIILKEVCVDGLQQAIKANQLGADRIEFCQNLEVGGLTPNYDDIKQYLLQNNKTKLVIMARPRAGDFIYSMDELQQVLKIIKEIGIIKENYDKNNIIEGVVTGILELDQDQQLVISKVYIREVVQIAKQYQMYTVFHMAFDEISIENQQSQVQLLIDIGVKRILTKGGKFDDALKGKRQIQNLINFSQNLIEILPGKGLSHSNLHLFLDQMKNVNQVHGTKIISGMN